MIVVRNVGRCNIRINLAGKRSYLIPVGGSETVELPDEVKDLDFFNSLVDDGSLSIERDEPDEVIKEEAEAQQEPGEPAEAEKPKRRGRQPKAAE